MDVLTALAVAGNRHVPYSARKAILESPEPHHVGTAELNWAKAELQRLKKSNAWVRIYRSPGYPKWLSEIPDPPLALMGRGALPPDDAVCLGLVGPRRPSTYGRRIARLLATDLAREGLVLVSGLARGIDAIGHEASLKEKRPTVAVLGCGIDRIYPPEHALLRDRIVECGAVVTEFFCGEPPRRENFPRRNRIISGLSRGVLLVEAGEQSGARITARHAVEQSRDVFAVPGPIDAPLSMWPNRLISEGAKLVASSADILEEFLPRFRRETSARKRRETDSDLSVSARELLPHLSYDTPVAIDDLARKGGLPVSNVLQTLGELEILGVVTKQADARYLRVSS